MANEKAASLPDHIYGGPTKRLFVSMLTRDIELDEAILDLLDNSVDGAMRENPGGIYSANPFKGFEAHLNVSRENFEIWDNCGGIPNTYIEDAFSLGRPSIEKDKDLPTIGMYGIGMKRAIFKIANSARVVSAHPDAHLAVTYNSEWLRPDNDQWDLPLETIEQKPKRFGVRISSTNLKTDIANQFASEIFRNRLFHKISEHFGYIIQKGFKVFLNKEEIPASTLPLLTHPKGERSAIQPFDYVTEIDGVHAKVTIGFFRPLVKDKEVDDETNSPSSAEKAGISVVCNDRVVLLHDRTLKTGWGDGGVPRFHPQFRAIAGLVVLHSKNPLLLPVSTTKRDLDVGSDVYLIVRQACMEGLKIFTNFTNRWKGREAEASALFDGLRKMDARQEVRLAADHGSVVTRPYQAKKFKPNLPMPERGVPKKRITFLKEAEEVETVSLYLFSEKSVHPAIVGEECFDRFLKDAKS